MEVTAPARHGIKADPVQLRHNRKGVAATVSGYWLE